MDVDVGRVLEARERVRSYRDRERAVFSRDDRLAPDGVAFLRPYLEPAFRVLDVGCGDGTSLLESAACFREGVGVDTDPLHLALAREAGARLGVDNVRFLHCDSLALPSTFAADSFDVVFSELGPLVDSWQHVQAALRVLRPDGLVFMAEVRRSASTGWREWTEGGLVHRPPTGFVPSEDRAATLLLLNGVDVRISARLARRRVYADVYEWLLARFAGWGPDVAVDDRFLRHLSDFVDAYAEPDGTIAVTEQHWWVGGVKRPAQRRPRPDGQNEWDQAPVSGSQASVPPRSTSEKLLE
jgi:SAM-dependent methyltransferase